MAALAINARSGQFTGSGKQETETFGEGRTCRAPDCGAPLSVYNPNDRCALHPRSIVRLVPLAPNDGW